MLAPYLDELRARRIILGSSSPRRRDIMSQQLGLVNVEVIASTFPETLSKASCTPEEYVKATCMGKTTELLQRTPALLSQPSDILICADTIISFDGKILEKPATPADAIDMLRQLSGQTHQVLTCVSISTSTTTKLFVESTQVTFADLDDVTIESYVQTGEPMDKAGSYGYQSGGASFVSSIAGCYYNVVGFPAHRFCRELRSFLAA